MRKASNYSQIFEPYGAVRECDSFTCYHCQKVIQVPVGASPTDLGGLCRGCLQLICPTCVNKGVCVPFEEVATELERKYNRDRMYNRLLGRE